jgi:hypothetical protein
MQLRGLAGTDVTINAPLGVTVLTDEGEVLGDLTTNNQTITIAQGTGILAVPVPIFFTNDPDHKSVPVPPLQKVSD